MNGRFFLYLSYSSHCLHTTFDEEEFRRKVARISKILCVKQKKVPTYLQTQKVEI